MYVDPGELNKRIAIVRETQELDSGGSLIGIKDITVLECWAKFSRLSGTEIISGNADFSRQSVRFLIRATHVTLDRKMIVLYGGERYQIVYLNNYSDDGRYIELLCEKTENDSDG